MKRLPCPNCFGGRNRKNCLVCYGSGVVIHGAGNVSEGIRKALANYREETPR